MRGTPDKTRVLDVKPLRTLKPVFPAYSNVPRPPPLPVPANSSHPPGFSPTDPSVASQGAQTAAAPTPLRAYRDPSESDGADDKSGIPGTASRKKARRSKDWLPVNNDYVVPLNSSQRDDGNEELVDFVLMTFDGLRRKLSQLEDAREGSMGLIKRVDLKVGNVMMSKGFRTNMRRRIGAVPGVKVGDIFFFRMELCVVGLHAHPMGGIDYANIGDGPVDEAVALSIVSSGMYDDDTGDSNVLIYSGQGGGTTSKDKQATDQKLVRGNLALERSLRRANVVRVIRGVKDPFAANSKVYLYDGLYTIQESWSEKGKVGANAFKYKLVRIQGQPVAFAVWKTIERWKELVSTRPGLIVADLTGGAESSVVPVVNEVDNKKGPEYFNYFYTLRYFRSYSLIETSHGCDCHECKPDNPNCSCIQANGGLSPYTGNGILVGRRPVLHECGPSCLCYPNCKNRVSQTGLKVRLEVFKTKDRGWGLHSWDPLRAGAFICEYAGEVIDKAKLVQQLDGGEVNDYVFDTSRVSDTFKWNHESDLLEESNFDESSEEFNLPSTLIITAKNMGNVARFMNHSCYPNVFWQPVIYQNKNETFLHIAFYAKKHIPPLTELTYDYGTLPSNGDDSGVEYRQRSCLCGYGKCRGYFSV
ncbi:hypothetical protein MLD38_018831 [Melastoma candidum]|uniref:Uncharacterized protein n=1 Tax=Melastoma candidum TaxID=119954 RepID=A0ACB9QV51_9MYRT|nr:hypothetical protein MLD38_018831 [Melastoma candidum]